MPASVGFGSLRVGTTSSLGKTVTVTNTGNAPLVVSAVSIGGAAAWDFDIRADGCTGVAVGPGGSCTLTLGFEPAAVGTRSAVLTIAHNAPGGASTVALSGTGIANPGGIIP